MFCPWLNALGYHSAKAPVKVRRIWPTVLAEALSALVNLNMS